MSVYILHVKTEVVKTANQLLNHVTDQTPSVHLVDLALLTSKKYLSISVCYMHIRLAAIF